MTDGQTSGPIDPTPGTPVSDKNQICSSDLNKYCKQSSNIFGNVMSSVREGVQTKKTFLNGHCPFRGEGVDPCPVGLVLFLTN